MRKLSLALIFSVYIAASQQCLVLDEFNPQLEHTVTEVDYTFFPWYGDDNSYTYLVHEAFIQVCNSIFSSNFEKT